MKKQLTAISIATCIIASSMSGFAAEMSDFSDIPDGWSHDAVVYAVDKGILKGDNNQVFPNRLLTRAELAAIINRTLNLSEKTDISAYTDVSGEAWYYDDMAIAVNAGIFQGYDKNLNPEASVTREEVFAVIARAYNLHAADTDLSGYNDSDSISDWAKDSAAALIEKDYVNGDGNNDLRPKDNITRAELAQILYNISIKSNAGDIIEPVSTDTPEETQQPTATPKATPRASSTIVRGSSSNSTASHYVLMNIPYEAFYGAENVSVKTEDSDKININYDAISSATNKVGNYGKSGGAYHSGVTAAKDEEGNITAVGSENDATNKGVIWPVKVKNMSALASLGGTVITDSSEVTVATFGRGQTSSTELKGYKTLTEAADYSYYVLSSTPDYYMELSVEDGKPVFSTCSGTAIEKANIEPTVSYGTKWGDIQLDLIAAEDVADKQINAVVITARDENGDTVTSGLIHLYNIWTYSDLAWNNDQLEGLNGAVITNIRYYCNNSAENASELEYYVYDYEMNTELLPAYDGEVTAAFEGSTSITLTGLPEDIENLKAQVYHSTGGRNPVYTYLTPLTVDPADDDIDPTTVDVIDGKIIITPGEVTNNAGETKTYGNPEDDTTYTIALSSDNYAPFTVEAEYTAE